MAEQVTVGVNVDSSQVVEVDKKITALEERLKEAKSLADDLASIIGSMKVKASLEIRH